MNKSAGILLFLVLIAGNMMTQAGASQHQKCKINIGNVVSAQGSVAIRRVDGDNWERVTRRSEVCEGDTIRTGDRSRAAISLVNQTVMRINQKSTTTLENLAPQEEARSVFRLLSGIIQFFSRKPRNYQISTVTATIGVRGTEFVVVADENKTDVTVFEGVVQAENGTEPLALASGETVSIIDGQAMRSRVLVNPRNQVQWGLYYPPVLSAAEVTEPELQAALGCIARGDYVCAFEELDRVDSSDQSVAFQHLRSSLLVAVGQTDEAQSIIDNLLQSNSADATALALQSVIAVSQNRVDDALSDGDRAVNAAPGQAAAGIALSYAQQANLDLPAAIDTLRQTLASNPENSLVKARLAELLLATGKVSEAREMAQNAVESDDRSARAHTVLGYTALAQIDTDAAIQSFNMAQDIDSADPLPHLGLGLALIRDGELAEGRKEIEAAVALDSNSAILRPYLGRAYFEENRPPLDAEQYAMAKQLDPQDPTAFLFDALRKHAENNPVGAVQDLQASIERNDNRAVYRGRNLLDQDRAAKGASLSRIYDTLGFTSLGLVEAGNSLAVDPANDSAHRFLSDSYRNIRRREIARVSELLQAQMLQDVNLNPVQPSVSATNLNIGSGAGDVGLNEFTGLFESNSFNPAFSLISGDNDTNGAEVVLSGIHDSVSYSVGGFHYKTDGWRENNAQEQDLGNLFVQWAATPRLNLQLEITSRDSTEGDLAFNFDADAFDPTLTNERELDSERIGLRYSPTKDSDILVSHISTERSEKQTFDGLDLLFTPALPGCDPVLDPFAEPPNNCFIPAPAELSLDSNSDGDQNEIQYIQKSGRFNFTVGMADTEVDSEELFSTGNPPLAVIFNPPGPPPALPFPTFDVSPVGGSQIAGTPVDSKLTHKKSYIYSTIDLNTGTQLILGVSKDDYEEGFTDEEETNGKVGLIWKPDNRHTLRLATFEVMKPALVNNRSLEPTQVAGFNQLYDDINATKSEFQGIGYDLRINSEIGIGVELTSRKIEEPVIDFTLVPEPGVVFDEREESVNRVYLHWTPTNQVAVSVEFIDDSFEAESGILTQTDIIPEKVDTSSLPISVKYFSPRGWFAGITATAVDQKVTRDRLSSQASGKDDFNVVDLSLGYRLAKRRGSLSLNILNAGDEEFNYQDDTYREFRNEPSTGPYFPETTVQFQANLVF